jgi:D-alanyl-D-alanine carboxypeptidase
MAKATKIGNALTALGLVGMLAACATPGNRLALRAPAVGKADAKIARGNVGLATRAQSALEKGDYATAVDLAERAVTANPGDAGFRALLGNIYFAAGRFASAEQAYNDSLSLNAGQPALVLKLALVQVAQGKNAEAAALLDRARGVIDPADHGLALALAGRPDEAIAVLDPAARTVGADARVRQNLALAHALSGDWTMARLVAEQDLAPDQVDARIAQWMAFAKPKHPSEQVASLTGVTPAPVDPGQPVRLALVRSDQRLAAADLPQPAPAPVAEAVPVIEEVAMAEPLPAPPVEAAPMPAPTPVPAPVAVAAPPAEVLAAAVPAFVPAVEPAPVAEVAAPAVEAPRPALSPRAARLDSPRVEPRKAAAPRVAGPGPAVVQLGAFSSKANVNSAWGRYSARFPALRGYDPATARVAVNGSTIYRLSVAGFASNGEAQRFCASLKNSGGNCFVRSVAGGQPVRLASR